MNIQGLALRDHKENDLHNLRWPGREMNRSTNQLESLPMPPWMSRARGEDLAQEVDDHRIEWHLEEWEDVFSEAEWSTLRPRFETIASWSVDGCIARRTLLEAAKATDPEDSLTLHIGAMVWGVGTTKGRNRNNVGKGLKDEHAKAKMLLLCDSVRDSDGCTESFRRLANKADLGLRGLGSSFATKTLYFLGFGFHDSSGLRPLILDMMVARALRATAPSFPRYPGFSGKWYLAYLRLAQRWSDELGVPDRPDVIEYLLFRHAKGLQIG
jgi:hypothetical protein